MGIGKAPPCQGEGPLPCRLPLGLSSVAGVRCRSKLDLATIPGGLSSDDLPGGLKPQWGRTHLVMLVCDAICPRRNEAVKGVPAFYGLLDFGVWALSACRLGAVRSISTSCHRMIRKGAFED